MEESERQYVSPEEAAAMGISEEVLAAVEHIVGRRPTIDELSTLVAMWQSNRQQQSLLVWLRGQQQNSDLHEYIYTGNDTLHSDIREPRIKECREIALSLYSHNPLSPQRPSHTQRGSLLYMVGKVSGLFIDSYYGRQFLHLSEHSIPLADDEALDYTRMIIDAMTSASLIEDALPVAQGGLFGSLLSLCAGAENTVGFDILTCREVRTDAFLFGEEQGRFVTSVAEEQDDLFLEKLDQAGIDGCFLGRATKGRILVDGMDFGDISQFCLKP